MFFMSLDCSPRDTGIGPIGGGGKEKKRIFYLIRKGDLGVDVRRRNFLRPGLRFLITKTREEEEEREQSTEIDRSIHSAGGREPRKVTCCAAW